MAKIKGLASVFGAKGTVVYGPFNTDANNVTRSMDNSHSASIEELTDHEGELLGAAIRNERLTLDVEFVPVGVRKTDGTVDTTKNAIADATKGLEFPGASAGTFAGGWTKVTIANAVDTTDATNADSLGLNGDWIYMEGGSRTFEAEGFTGMRLSLMRPLTAPQGMTVTDLTNPVT